MSKQTQLKQQRGYKRHKKNELIKVDSHLIAAKQALSSGDYAKTIEEATVSIKDNPNNAEAYSIRGFATALNGDTAKGLTDTKNHMT